MTKINQNNRLLSIPSTNKTFTLVALLCSVMYFHTLHSNIQQNETIFEARLASLKAQMINSFNESIEHLDQRFGFFAEHYQHMPNITNSVKNNQREQLQQLVQHDYYMLKKKNPHVFVMHFFDTQNTTVLRMHKPHSFGDDLTDLRPIVSHVNRHKASASGFEVGKNGITYRITLPLFDHSLAHIGVLEFGIKPNYFVEHLHQHFGVKSRVLIKSEELTPLTYQTNFKKMDKYSVIVSDPIFDHLDLSITESKDLVYDNGHTYLLISDIVLHSYKGEELVRFQVLEDVSAFSDKHNRLLWRHIITDTSLFLAFLLFVYLVFKRYNKELMNAVQQLNISERRRLEVVHSSHKDELTQVYNRRYFNEYMNNLLTNDKRKTSAHSVIFFDLDHFKEINDQYGHLIGDEVLANLSTYIINKCRSEDMLFRWGGEEFCLLMEHTSITVAVQRAENLRQGVSEQSWPEGINLTISLGVTEIRSDDDLTTLQARLDKLLYQAKEDGRNCYVYG